MYNNDIKTQKTTFWNFLKEQAVEIPIIQRDYAQGRLGKEYLRKSFLSDIKTALDEKKEMKLDFVYGTVDDEDKKLSPLDGQQRLTTLWLLHWYIALMSGNLNEEVCKILKKFTYETRISSREFCQNLCITENFIAFKDFKTAEKRRIVDFITSRTWFYSAWKQDPTIQSVLRMLGGTEINDKIGEDIIDGLEELFKDTNQETFTEYWEILKRNDAPIVFYHLPLENFGLSDDLYIKMNARGKQLTSFENFKADLVGYIRKQAEENKDWKKLLDQKKGIPIKLDTDWTDIFWKKKSKDNKIDEIYFAFLNRFFLCELICQKINGKYKEKIDETPSYKYLYGKEESDINIKYEGFERYECFNIDTFDALIKVLNNCKDYAFQEYFPKWVELEKDFQFIPKYIDNNTITTLTQNGRVVFHAISKYLQIGEFDETSFEQWMRVVWNIVENNNVGMIGAMRLIDELGEHSHKIYEFLVSNDLKIKSEAAKEQVTEEIAKAKQIRTGGDEWESKIIEAEKYAFFKGAIRFLFQDGKGNVTNESWNNFNTKWSNAQKYFDKDGVKDSKDCNYKSEALLLKAVLFHVKDFWHLIEPNKHVFDNDNLTWKWNILLEHGWENAVDEIMMGNLTITARDDCLIYKNLYMTNLLDYVANAQKGSRIRWIHNHRALYQERKQGIILDDDKFYRNRILLSTHGIEVNSDHKIPNCDFFWGWDINFKYQKKDGNPYYFQWNTDGNLYILENNSWKIKKEEEPKEFYCIGVSDIEDSEQFIKALESLIAQAR